MKTNELIQLSIFLISLILITPILGRYMAKVYLGEKHLLTPVFGWLERGVYKVCRIEPINQMEWKEYAFSLAVFNGFGFLAVFFLMILQNRLPLNPLHIQNTSWHLALNTAVSFVTNTNWQSYSGESSLSILVQMLGLSVQNFLSAATGMTVLVALMRGLRNKQDSRIGNFWVDISRSVIYILLPLSVIMAVLLCSQGVIQSFGSFHVAQTLENGVQQIPSGPVASQEAIKQLGTNGGGYFGVNSAHPFENPTPFSNFLEMLAILAIPAALTFTYGRFAGSNRQGWTLFLTMIILFIAGFGISFYAESGLNHALQVSGNMEGKEMRFGVMNSVLWSVATTSASNGSVNAMMDSLSPLSGLVAIFNIMLGEVIFGGAGAGLYGMAVFVIITVFIAGLMVGRTPEYLGKKIEAYEVKMSMLAILAPCIMILLLSALAVSVPEGISSISNKGPHGLTQVLYAFSSAAGNNGSAFAGLNTNTPFYNILMAFAMIIGRFGIILPVLAIAGKMGGKNKIPPSSGTFRSDNWLFVVLLLSVIMIIGGLTFFPAVTLGPIAEHLLVNLGMIF